MSLFTQLKNVKYYRRQIIDKQIDERYQEDGVIIPITITSNEITLNERGQLKASRYQNNTYNYYQWYLKEICQLQLSHLHQQNIVTTSAPFYCGKDCYHAQLMNTKSCITLTWSISGPRKDLYINTNYY